VKWLIPLAAVVSLSAQAQSFTANPTKACSELTQANNSQVLVIAAEGRGEYDDAHANSIFNYVSARKSGVDASDLPRRLGKTGILTDGLMFPLAHDFGDRIDIVSFDLESTDPQPFDNAMSCAKLWMSDSSHKLILIGHSHGASRVVNMAIMLFQAGVDVNTVVTVDALPADGGTISRPPGVTTYLNFYQTKDMSQGGGLFGGLFSHFIYRGQAVDHADNADQLVTDIDGHFTIPGSPTVIAAVKAQFAKLVGPAQVASAQ